MVLIDLFSQCGCRLCRKNHTLPQHRKERSLKKFTKSSNVADSESSYRSLLESSLKQITLKSTTSISFLKENLYKRLDFSGKKNHNGNKVNSIAEHHIIKTSTPISSSFAQNKFVTSKDFFGYEHLSGRIEAEMSGRYLERRPLRAQSDSEEEENGSYIEGRSRLVRATRSSAINRNQVSPSISHSSNHSNTNNHGHLANSRNSLVVESSGDYHNVNNSKSSLEASSINRSLVQESTFDKIRWIVWGFIYLKIISWISFDVWLLSRLRGNKIAAFLLFLPLLLYFSQYAFIWYDFSCLPSYIQSFTSTTSTEQFKASHLMDGFLKNLKSSFANIYSMLPSFSSLPILYSSIFGQRDESASIVSSVVQEQSYKLSVSPEELELLVKRILDKNNYNSNVQDFKSSHLQEELKDLQQQVKLIQQYQNDLQRSSNTKDAEIRSAQQNADFLSNKLQVLEGRIALLLEKSSSKDDVQKLSAEHEMWNKKIKILEEQLASQKLDTKDFIASFEKLIVAAFQSVVRGDKTSQYSFFNQWLDSKSTEIKLVIESLRKEQLSEEANTHKVIEGLVRHYIESLKVSEKHETRIWDSKSGEDVRKIVRDAIRLYDADKTGMVDYALESAGGSVISIRCSESYAEKRGMFSLFGLPLWTDQNSPRIAIQPDIHPGRCWSFKGSHGFLVIQFSYSIRPTGFTLEHIPVSLSPTGSIDSAPREFSVWALSSEKDTEGTLLGQYSYDDKGEPLQYFTVQNHVQVPISYVELKIHSNHGNLEYTCLYRLRVHGTHV
ncbi:hypothetical protein JTE90_009031 [Oedothorax gibbosus]|uniref:SUN domain-containing protein n=1 Tax=Oedothorax gibbosus TaxID=931172 RepID=A0AAV6VHY0_9ARAC|nr:hypothetical protein JTE90_009031 [Oedothorax gibbosus]